MGKTVKEKADNGTMESLRVAKLVYKDKKRERKLEYK